MLLGTLNSSVASDCAIDIEETCPGCFATRLRPLGKKSGYELFECADCGVVFTTVRNHNQAVGDLYDHYYDRARFVMPPVVAASLKRFVRSCEGFRSSNRWLDIGYGEGGMLEIAERSGWSCYGTDIAPQALEYGRQRGWVVTDNAEHDSRFPLAAFDVVTMIEFLEHVPRPQEFLQSAARWLRPGGLLYITTPNAGSLNRRLLGLKWSIFSPPEHMTIWTAGGLRSALSGAGFDSRRVRTEGLNPSEIIARVRARDSSGPAAHRNIAGFAINNAFSKSPWRRAVKGSINRCLSAFRAGDTLKVWAVRS